MDPRKRQGILYYVLGVLLLLAAFGILSLFRGRWKDVNPNAVAGPALSWRDEQASSDGREDAFSEKNEVWYVYVTGEVVRPGVYEVAPGDRMYVAVEKAGGFTVDADRERINLAAPLKDAMHIKVPSRIPAEGNSSQILERNQVPREGNANYIRENKFSGVSSEGLLNINAANPEDLEKLPGIGQVLAERIVRTREELGGFKDTGEIIKVPGIGAKRLEKITPLITCGMAW
ncbi:MAG TPA: ComEA family DNA-binding protein [Synergistaceae bacterium]|nr:ComEA family DNA-binding protein [Synergistaceae bacterium]HPJ25828.1 ComEA family DNA-binding protein [Synergistaceae bacterium]HPQ37539.1 ComEA family DNA-binding protein [Synergistaceae bacterium]